VYKIRFTFITGIFVIENNNFTYFAGISVSLEVTAFTSWSSSIASISLLGCKCRSSKCLYDASSNFQWMLTFYLLIFLWASHIIWQIAWDLTIVSLSWIHRFFWTIPVSFQNLNDVVCIFTFIELITNFLYWSL